MPRLQMVDLQRQHDALASELQQAMAAVIADASFIKGPAVAAFEGAFATYLRVPHVIGCGSGTDALQMALMVLGVGPGDEIITTPFTFVATVETIVLLGAKPVFVDIDPATFNLRVDQIESRLTPRTRAILPVHLYGLSADMDAILAIGKRHELPVIEDTAQATGALVGKRQAGTMGRLGCFSFFPAKNLGCFGDGGAVVTHDDDLAARCRMIGNHGSQRRYHHECVGINSRLDTLQAAILSVKLPHLDRYNAGRQRVAAAYDAAFAGLPDLQTPATAPDRTHVYQQYTVRSSRRDALKKHLDARGVPSAVHYPTPLHRQPAFAHLYDSAHPLPAAEAAANEVLSLPMFPEMTDEEIGIVTEAMGEFFS